MSWEELLDRYPELDRAIERIGGAGEDQLGADAILVRLLMACVVGFVIGQVYRRTFTGKKFAPTLPDTHMLLCLGGAMIWLVVADNLVRAFGLAGTIGLIRYRTVVRDPKDTTILLFSMVLGMACGLGQLHVAVLGTAVVLLVLLLLYARHRAELKAASKRSRELLSLLGGDEPQEPKPPQTS